MTSLGNQTLAPVSVTFNKGDPTAIALCSHEHVTRPETACAWVLSVQLDQQAHELQDLPAFVFPRVGLDPLASG